MNECRELSPSYDRSGLYDDQWDALNEQVLALWMQAQSVKVQRQLVTLELCGCCDGTYLLAHCAACQPGHRADWDNLRI